MLLDTAGFEFDEAVARVAPEVEIPSQSALAKRIKEKWDSLSESMTGGHQATSTERSRLGPIAVEALLTPGLINLLLGASRIASANGRPKAGIQDLFKALSLDETLVKKLSTETGLVLKALRPET